jgi:hypothetical protein
MSGGNLKKTATHCLPVKVYLKEVVFSNCGEFRKMNIPSMEEMQQRQQQVIPLPITFQHKYDRKLFNKSRDWSSWSKSWSLEQRIGSKDLGWSSQRRQSV